MENYDIYTEISKRTGGEIFIGSEQASPRL